MKMIKKFGLLVLASGAFIACSTDDDGTTGGGTTEARSELYVSNNTDGRITVYDVADPQSVSVSSFGTFSTDGEGVFYNAADDEITQVSRSGLRLNAYTNILGTAAGLDLVFDANSEAVLESPRDLAVSGDIYVVSDNADVDDDPNTADGRFFIFQKQGGGFALRNVVETDFAVWGIQFVGNTLYAVVDKTSDVAIFANFVSSNTVNAQITPTKRITIEGINRTHGIAESNGTMILTDIGDASSDTDGGFHIISDFASKFNDVANGGTLLVANNQVRVAGAATLLGNPIAAEYDAENNIVFIAERANGGGRVLAFTDADAGGNVTPTINNTLSGASSLYLYKQ